jgi:phospholipid transport system substrate-binding protein
MTTSLQRLGLALCIPIGVALGGFWPGLIRAAVDPAVAQVQGLDEALLASMKAGASETVMARYRKLAPVVEQVFDLRAMTGFAVGTAWQKFSADEQAAAVAAFARLTIASYANNFKSFDGERFEISSEVVTRGTDKVVQTQLIPLHAAPVSLNYRMRESSGSWKIIDVYYGAVSQLTIRRSDFAAPIAAGGAQGLIDHVNALSDELTKP